jgi:hypothetical protein
MVAHHIPTTLTVSPSDSSRSYLGMFVYVQLQYALPYVRERSYDATIGAVSAFPVRVREGTVQDADSAYTVRCTGRGLPQI